MYELLIINGRIVDGTGRKAYKGDIGIRGGRIVEIGEGLAGNGDSDKIGEIIDAEGLVVCPGFIDVHSHNDLVPFMEEHIQELKLYQGVTTELVGQCGLGVIPCETGDELWRNYTSGVVGNPGIGWSFPDVDNYYKELEACGLKNNLALLIAHGAVRTKVMGFDQVSPTTEQLEEMCKIVTKAMEAGAYGMSLGLQYMPGIFSKKEELIQLCRIVKSYDGIVMVHLRNHDYTILKALEEMISMAKESGVKLHISHLRSYASQKFGCGAYLLIKAVEDGIHNGVDITFDEHIYKSGSTLLTQLLPPWVSGNGQSELIENLKSQEIRARIKYELEDESLHYTGWDNYYGVTGWDNILITSVKNHENRKYIGKTVGELAKSANLEAIDIVAQLLISEKGGVGVVTMEVFSEEDIIALIKHPLQMVGSDSIPAGTPHPRLYGNYPLFIGKFVREKKALSLENAIYKATLLPATTLKMKDIGELSVDKLADITIFDYDVMQGFEDYRNPRNRPVGVKYVILNGQVALKDGVVVEQRHGRVLRH